MKRFLIALLFGSMPTFALVPTHVGCAPTAEAAVARLVGQSADAVVGAGAGYRVVSLRTDVLRAKKYALVASCADAARPLTAIEVTGQLVMQSRMPSVRLGDRVKVIAGNADSRMELTGRAQEGGGMSEVVRVQIPKFSDDTATSPVIRCRVVGNDVVEVIR